MRTLAFVNPKGGVGTTSLVHHLAWMFHELGMRTVAIDLDPQAHLTEMFLSAQELQDLWLGEPDTRTVLGALDSRLTENGAMNEPILWTGDDQPALLPGHLGLSRFELDSAAGDVVATAIEEIAAKVARKHGAELVLVDPGPGLGAWHRAAVRAADHVVLPLSADLYSLQGLKLLGPLHAEWRKSRSHRMQPLGYIRLERALQGLRPVKALPRWAERISAIYHHEVLGRPEGAEAPDPDPHHLGTFRYFPSLAYLAQEARKPMFLLRPADGAVGGLVEAVLDCYRDFKSLALRIAAACEVTVPSSSIP